MNKIWSYILWATLTATWAFADDLSKNNYSWFHPYLLMDTESREILAHNNIDRKIHPASLSKLMTLYLVYLEMSLWRFTKDTVVTISKFATQEPPSKLWLRVWQEITVWELIKAVAIKSANDAATALWEFISGSEEVFIDDMNEIALALWLENSHFKNAHGLTSQGHYMTARDLGILFLHIQEDFPELFEILGNMEIEILWHFVRHWCKRLVEEHNLGIHSCKTWYTRAARYWIAAIVEYNGKEILAILTWQSTIYSRNNRLIELLEQEVK